MNEIDPMFKTFIKNIIKEDSVKNFKKLLTIFSMHILKGKTIKQFIQSQCDPYIDFSIRNCSVNMIEYFCKIKKIEVYRIRSMK